MSSKAWFARISTDFRRNLPALYTPQMVFKQDEAPCHMSSSTMGYLDRKTV